MKTNKKELIIGIILLAGFSVVLVGLFSPVFNGKNPITYFDNLYNSISKGSVYYIPKLLEETNEYEKGSVDVSIGFLTNNQADEMLQVYRRAGIESTVEHDRIMISTDLMKLLTIALQDSDILFNNHGDQLKSKYGMDEKRILYTWWLTLKDVEKELNKSNRFKEAKFVNSVLTKAVECAYNYHNVVARQISDEVLFVVISLLFYVVYTMWFGYAIMYVFIGLGLKL